MDDVIQYLNVMSKFSPSLFFLNCISLTLFHVKVQEKRAKAQTFVTFRSGYDTS